MDNQKAKKTNNFGVITRNTIFLLIGRIVTGVFQLVIFAIIARQLGVEKFGLLTLSLTVGSIFGIISDFGCSNLMIREVSKDKTKASKYFVNGTLVKIFIHLSFFTVFYFFLFYHNNADYNTTIILACVSSIFAMFSNFYISFFNAFEKMNFTALLSSFQSGLISVICLSIILVGLKDVELILCGYILANFIMLIVSSYLVFKLHSLQIFDVDLRFSLNFIRHSIFFGIFIIGGMLYFQSDTIMLSIMKDRIAVGIYQAPMRLILVLDIFPLLLSTAMYPTISKIFIDSKSEAINFVSKSLKHFFIIGIPVSFTICFFSERIIFFIFGKDFFDSIQVLKILVWIFPIRICCHLLGTTLSAADKQNHRAVATGLSALLNILLNLILIPLYSYNGAAFASVITGSFLAMYYYLSIQKEFQIIQLKKIFVFPIVSLVMMFITVFLIKYLNSYKALTAAFFVYTYCLILLEIINKKHFWVFKNIFSIFFLKKK